MRDEDIDLSEQPEPSEEMIAKAIVREGLEATPRKEQVTLRVDADVLEWFRASGSGYQTRMNGVLRAYMNAAKRGRKE